MYHWIDVVIVALLPLTALLTVMQTRPYFALVSRGIMGAVAVLLYTTLGAPDVALTEALVGTLLTVVLYAVAVRSSLVVRLGCLGPGDDAYDIRALRRFCVGHDLTLRRMAFDDMAVLIQALQMGRIDVVQAPARTLRGWVPALEGLADDRRVTVLARHGRWHETQMGRSFQGREVVIRLGAAAAKGGA